MSDRGCPIRRSPSFELNREAIRRSTPKYKGTLDPCPLYSCAVRGSPVKHTHLPLSEYGGLAQAAVLLVSEELSNEATTQRAHTIIPRIGSAYKQKGYSSHPPN